MRMLLFVIALQACLASELLTLTVEQSIGLNAGSTREVSCNATAYDEGGFDGDTATAVFWNNASSREAADHNSSHYTTTCSLEYQGNYANISCIFDIWYYAKPGNWTCLINESGGANISSGTIVQELMALASEQVTFKNTTGGGIRLGNASVPEAMEIRNLGNVNISIMVSGTDLACNLGGINVSYVLFKSTPDITVQSGTRLSDEDAITGLVVPRREDECCESSGYLYWIMDAPKSSAKGDCEGEISVTAY